MIAVRIPQEIRKYKEKILLGLTARQLLSTMIALIICVPIYFYGRGKISEDLLSWLIIILAIPFVSIGFFNFNGMPMEKFIVAFVKSEVLYPQKRKYKSENAFREWERMADKEDIKIYGRPSLKEKIEASLERAYLLAEAEEKNIENFDVDKIELITVKDRRQSGNNPKKDKKDKKKKIKSPC
ncbi:MAG TPA: PrgI family protein [Defluviitaleaceae bacterium]|nr:PrgI family protein [Defluviitaleaceae bacterium]